MSFGSPCLAIAIITWHLQMSKSIWWNNVAFTSGIWPLVGTAAQHKIVICLVLWESSLVGSEPMRHPQHCRYSCPRSPSWTQGSTEQRKCPNFKWDSYVLAMPTQATSWSYRAYGICLVSAVIIRKILVFEFVRAVQISLSIYRVCDCLAVWACGPLWLDGLWQQCVCAVGLS